MLIPPSHQDLHPLFAPHYAEGFEFAQEHLLKQAATRVRLVARGGKQWRVELSRLDPWLMTVERLARIGEEQDEALLGDLADDLVAEIEMYGTSLMLADWLGITGVQWVAERRPALAVAIEAAARLNVRDVDLLIANVLADREAHPLVRRVAAHRARHVQFRDRALQVTAWSALRKALEIWLDGDPQAAASAIPSAVLGESEAVAWLCDVVVRRPAPAAHAAALGLLDLLSGATRARVFAGDQEREQVVHAVMARRARTAETSSSLAGSLVWLLGAAATHATLSQVIEVIHQAFASGTGDEPAGAVAAARLLVQGPLSKDVPRQIAALMPPETALAQRFWVLVHRARARSLTQ